MNVFNIILIGFIFVLMSGQVTADNDRLHKDPNHLYVCTFNVYVLGNVDVEYTDHESMGDEAIHPNVIPQRIKNLANVLAVGNFDLVCIQEVTVGVQGKRAVGDLVQELKETHNIEYRYFLSDDIGLGYGIAEGFAYLYNPDVVNPELPTGGTSYAADIEVSGRDFMRTQWRSGDFDFTLVSVHLAWGNEGDRQAGYEMARSILTTPTPSQFSQDPDIIVLGDFNRFGGGMDSVTVMNFEQGDFLAPNITFFDPNFDKIKEVTKASIQGKGVPDNNPQLLSTTVAQNRFVYDMILLSMDVSEELPKGSGQTEYNIDFGIICYDELNGFGYQNGAEILEHNDLKEAYSDHRPLWVRFRTDTNNADNPPSGLELIPNRGIGHGQKPHPPSKGMMDSLLSKIVIPLAITIAGIVIVLLIDRMRLPNLEILVRETANTDITYPESHPRAGQRWKFFRVSVRNKRMPLFLRWLPRQTAENCRATIRFTREKKEFLAMKGRWASTPEIPHLPEGEFLLRTLHPDPVAIPCAKQEALDIMARYVLDREAYAWNNEAYFEDWRPSRHKLDKGIYEVDITIETQNGKSFTQKLELTVGTGIEDSGLSKGP